MNPEMPKMRTLRKRINAAWPILVLIGLTTGLFFVDLSLPLGVAAGVPYLLCILWASRIGTRQVWMTAIATSLLVILGYALSPDGGEAWKVIMNRGLALMASDGGKLKGPSSISTATWNRRFMNGPNDSR